MCGMSGIEMKRRGMSSKVVGPFLEPPHCADISTCVKYRYLLSPLLTKMSLHEDRCLPPVDQLKEEVDSLLKHNKQGLESEFLDVSKKAWTLKKSVDSSSAKLGEEKFPPSLG